MKSPGQRGRPRCEGRLALDAEVVLEPRDSVAFDHFAAHTIHTAWNASDGETVLREAHQHNVDQPFTAVVGANGTPVP